MAKYYICTRQGRSAIYHGYASLKDARRNLRQDIADRIKTGEKWYRDSADYFRREDGLVMEVVEDGE